MHCTDTTWPQAAKAHICGGCGGCGHLIEQGEVYARWVCFDATTMTNRMHRE